MYENYLKIKNSQPNDPVLFCLPFVHNGRLFTNFLFLFHKSILTSSFYLMLKVVHKSWHVFALFLSPSFPFFSGLITYWDKISLSWQFLTAASFWTKPRNEWMKEGRTIILCSCFSAFVEWNLKWHEKESRFTREKDSFVGGWK